jgi:hypothetical protein
LFSIRIRVARFEQAASEASVRRASGPAVRASSDPDQEVTGEADTHGAHPDPAGDLDGEHGEGDGNADAPLEDLGEEAVAGVVVVGGVAAKPEVGEQRRHHGPCAGTPTGISAGGSRGAGRDPVQRAAVRLHIEALVLPGADEQRRDVELDVVVVVALDHGREPLDLL